MSGSYHRGRILIDRTPNTKHSHIILWAILNLGSELGKYVWNPATPALASDKLRFTTNSRWCIGNGMRVVVYITSWGW